DAFLASPEWLPGFGPFYRGYRLRPGEAVAPALPVPEMVSQRRRAVARVLLIRLPVGAEFIGLERANRQPDLPLRRGQLDDLHRIRLTDRQLDLVAAGMLAGLMRIVELGHVDETFDAFIELDEGAEVRHAHHFSVDRV